MAKSNDGVRWFDLILVYRSRHMDMYSAFGNYYYTGRTNDHPVSGFLAAGSGYREQEPESNGAEATHTQLNIVLQHDVDLRPLVFWQNNCTDTPSCKDADKLKTQCPSGTRYGVEQCRVGTPSTMPAPYLREYVLSLPS